MKPWSITWGDLSLTDEQATGAHLAVVSELVGDGWDAVSPWSSPRALQAWIVALVASSNGGDVAAAVAGVWASSVVSITDALSERAGSLI